MQPEEILLIDRPVLDSLPSLAGPLLCWFAENARALPWREDPTPYRVWVSEVMLQQTRVEAVRGYFLRFVAELPDIPALAAVPDEVLLKLWEGLGYYSRARNMKRAAGLLVRDFAGCLPASYEQLRTLPGIGEYTAGAIASIAFGIPVPAVDGNVLRVLARILGSYADISRPEVRRAMRTAAASLLAEGGSPGSLNQALMELGATVCLPGQTPLCGACPAAPRCEALRLGCAGELPVKPEKKPRRRENRTVALLFAEDRVLLRRREERGLLAGLYEPLNLEGELSGEEVEQAVRELGGRPLYCAALGEAKHIFTHVEWWMRGYRVQLPAVFPPPPGALWADADALRGLAIPSAFRAYTKGLQKILGSAG